MAEVGNPTVIATLTVVAALLPVMFVSGMMGPYMSPIPANVSATMMFSFFVAVVLTPWLMMRFAGRAPIHHAEEKPGDVNSAGGLLGRVYRIAVRPVLGSKAHAWTFLLLVGAATIGSMVLFYTEDVTVKLLPFDNKSEVQVMLDLPEGTSLEESGRTLDVAAELLMDIPEITSIQSHAGTVAPFNFNGLVRHYFYRESQELGDLQVNLLPKGERERESHPIALEIRKRLKALKVPEGTWLKVVEVPPGPPVLSTLLAEVYGSDAPTRRAVADKLEGLFKSVPFIVNVDNSHGERRERLRFSIDQENLEYHGISESDVYSAIQSLLGSTTVGYSHRGEGRWPVAITVALPKSERTLSERLLATPVPANALPGSRGVVELGGVLKIRKEKGSYLIYRHNLRPVEMVQADLAGEYEAPICGMLAVQKKIDETDWGDLPKPEVLLHGQPVSDANVALSWDGEWEVTWVTFRDMRAAFMVALLGIYLLVVGQFGSFKLPLVILTPVPLTLIGIMLGHWLFHAPFTATSMIDFIAFTGIIVRNSILLVDFIRHA